MNKLYLILLFSFFSTLTFSQQENLLGIWTNGFVEYSSSIYNDSIVIFEGGDLHEGGYAFSIIIKPDKRLYIFGRHPKFMEYPSIGETGNKVIFSKIQNEKYILVKDSQGNIVDFLISVTNHNLREIRISNRINHELAGIYLDKATGKKITFLPNEKTVKGLVEKQNHYSFGCEFDSPINIIIINGQSFYYELTENGLETFIAKRGEYDDWTKLEKVETLEKVDWFNLSNNENLKGKYQFASTQLLIDDILSSYTSFQLKIMRNEIFARHGYIFKTSEMNEYFKNQDWYKPDTGNINEKITVIEKLNVLLIKRYEEKKNQ